MEASVWTLCRVKQWLETVGLSPFFQQRRTIAFPQQGVIASSTAADTPIAISSRRGRKKAQGGGNGSDI